MPKKSVGSGKFGAFSGVFVPTSLSILGVILFLRLGYIVGSAGILGAIAIIFLAVSITLSTGLSLSSITTNIRIGAGGAYSIISKTLGLEVGGSVGIPLYLAQTFSVLLYIFGFAETYHFIFPDHPRILILLGTFLALVALTGISVKYAVKAQKYVFYLVLLALVSIFAGGGWWEAGRQVVMVSNFTEAPFWSLFALFFPAVTGLMAGVGMSGELTDPKRQIPKGVMWALGVTTIIYVIMVFWFGYSADAQTLINNNLAIAKLAAFSPLVLAGILAATFSSALTTFVAAPRLLQALGDNGILPASRFFAETTSNNEPRNATLVTGAIIGVVLPFSNLDAIAPFLTMFFLITYGMINLVVFIEQSLELVSFRPTFEIPKFVPLFGAVGSVVFMFYIDVLAGVTALGFLFFTYMLLVQRKLSPKHGDVRSGLFVALSEWAAKKVMSLPKSTKHIWRPNLLLPIQTSRKLLGSYPLIKSIVYPNGTLSVLGMETKEGSAPDEEDLSEEEAQEELQMIDEMVEKYGREGIFTSNTTIHADDYIHGVCLSMEAIEGQFFHPNIVFLPSAPDKFKVKELDEIFYTANETESGLIFFDKDKDIGLGSEEDVHIWLTDDVLEGDFYDDRVFDLAMLVAYRMHKNWVGNITLWMCTDEENEKEANDYLDRLVYESRFPAKTEKLVSLDSFKKSVKNAPKGDIHIVPCEGEEHLRELIGKTKNLNRSFLYVIDSGEEDILA